MPKAESASALQVIDNFYADPNLVRHFAVGCTYHSPYHQPTGHYDPAQAAGDYQSGTDLWKTSDERYLTEEIRAKLEAATGAPVDRAHWSAGTRWNGRFQLKFQGTIGFGAHNHIHDGLYIVGDNGWCVVVFLTPAAPLDRGLTFWQHNQPSVLPHDRWVIGRNPADWRQTNAIDNIYNRAVLHRGYLFHNGAPGFGTDIENCRMIQTFFFQEGH